MKNPHKALEAIEVLVGEDFGMDMEWIAFIEKNVDPKLKEAAKVISDIYMICHAENNHSCKHPDWENKKFEILRDYHESEIVTPNTHK